MEERFQTFTLLVSSIARNIRKIKTAAMAEFDLKSQHVSCLYYMYKVGSITSKELCEICDEDKANVSRSVKFLEERGLVKCDSKLTKRYLAPLELTENGKEIAEIISRRIVAVLSESSKSISRDELEIFYRCFAAINDNLQRISEHYDK